MNHFITLISPLSFGSTVTLILDLGWHVSKMDIWDISSQRYVRILTNWQINWLETKCKFKTTVRLTPVIWWGNFTHRSIWPYDIAISSLLLWSHLQYVKLYMNSRKSHGVGGMSRIVKRLCERKWKEGGYWGWCPDFLGHCRKLLSYLIIYSIGYHAGI